MMAFVLALLLQLPACEWCGAAEAPARLTSTMRLASSSEPGERLLLRGVVRQPNGRPAPNVLVYAYHTNAAGIYAKRGNETGNGRRHGYLRGWLRSGPNGEFTIDTIRPGTYPSRSDPAHIHVTIKEAGKAEYWVEDFVFAGDPLLRANSGRVVRLTRDAKGVWQGMSEIRLKP